MALAKLQLFALLSKICKETENHLGMADKTLAEFIVDLALQAKDLPEFSQLLTEKGAKAEAEFYMINGRSSTYTSLAPGDLYYKCDILVTNTAVNTRADEAIVGTAQFVTTGAIELKMGR